MKTVPNYPEGKNMLAGKTVLVTAAAGTGIGYATAQRCTEEGCAKLMISDIQERRLNEAAERIEAATGVKPFTVLCNVTKEEDVQGMFAAAIEQMGHGIVVHHLAEKAVCLGDECDGGDEKPQTCDGCQGGDDVRVQDADGDQEQAEHGPEQHEHEGRERECEHAPVGGDAEVEAGGNQDGDLDEEVEEHLEKAG